jgi:hypothetical protein
MRIDFRFLGLAGAMTALVGLAPMAACTTDDSDSPSTGGAGGSAGGSTTSPGGTGGGAGTSAGSGGSTSSTSSTVCARPILLDATKPGIANFDGYDGATSLSSWSFALGGDSSTGVYAGPFGYGDRSNGMPETFAMVAGQASSKYALQIADTLAQEYGGGMGLWISECLNATNLTGISFWARGNAPTGKAKFSICMKETTAATPSKPGNKTGTCPGTDTTCIHPNYQFDVTDTWTQFQVPWASFTGGDAAGTPVSADGRNIWQLQFDIGLAWLPDATGAYAPVPAPYELDVDTMTFY